MTSVGIDMEVWFVRPGGFRYSKKTADGGYI